jgi:hypothetical protein
MPGIPAGHFCVCTSIESSPFERSKSHLVEPINEPGCPILAQQGWEGKNPDVAWELRASQQLLQMPPLMGHIILNQKPERNRRIRIHHAWRLEP